MVYTIRKDFDVMATSLTPSCPLGSERERNVSRAYVSLDDINRIKEALMEQVEIWFHQNLDIVFLLYGCAFVFMGVAILVQSRRGSTLKLSRIIWILASFALLHGINEWLDMLSFTHPTDTILRSMGLFCLVTSFLFLFEFGVRLYAIDKDMPFLKWRITAIMFLFICALSYVSGKSLNTLPDMARYFLAFPGSLLTGIGFHHYRYVRETVKKPLHLNKYFLSSAIAFAVYAFLGGVVVSKGEIFPSNVLNSDTFLSVVHVPVQVFRAVSAVIAAISIAGVLKLFNWEAQKYLQDTIADIIDQKTKHKQAEEELKKFFDHAIDMLCIVDSDGYFKMFSSSIGKTLGYTDEELKSRPFIEFVHPDDTEATLSEFKKLYQGIPTISFENRYMRKDGSYRFFEWTSSPASESGLLYASARDITGQKQMEATIQQELAVQSSIAMITEALLEPKYDKYNIASIVYHEALRLTESKHGYASLIDEATGDNIAVNFSYMMNPECKVAETQRTAMFPKGLDGYNALWGHSLNTAEGFYTNSPKEHESFKGCAPEGHVEIKNFLSVPVNTGDKTIGQIALANSTRDYTEVDLSIAMRLASIYGVAIERKYIEERLRDSEHRFKTIFDQTPIGIAIIASHIGKFIQINHTYCNIVGYSKDEMLELTLKEITYPEDIQADLDNMQRLISGEISVFNMQKRYMRKDTGIIWVNLTCVPLWTGGEQPAFHLAVVEDITDRKQMEDVVKTERDKLNWIMEAMQDGIYITNSDYELEFVNRAIIREFGEVNFRKCYEYFYCNEHLQYGIKQCPHCKSNEVFSGKSVTWEWYCPRNNKTYSHFDAPMRNIDGSVSKFSVLHDISDIKNAHATVKRELDFQTAIAEVSEVLLSPYKNIVDISAMVNRQAIRLTESVHGYVAEIDRQTEELVWHTHTEMARNGQCNVDTGHMGLAFPKCKDGYNALWGHALNTKQAFFSNNPQWHPAYKDCIPEGHIPLTRYMAVPSIIGDKLIGQIALANAVRDYTDEDLDIIKRLASIYALAVERKRMEEQLRLMNVNLESMVHKEITKRQTQEQILIQQSKMAAMGEMIALIAHQWKQPLNAIGLVVQDLQDAYKFGELNEGYIAHTVDVIMRQVVFMGTTMDEFRNFFKPSKRKVTFDVKDAIDELISMFTQFFSKSSIKIDTKAKHNLSMKMNGYPNEFKQVILNILNNSKDAITYRRSSGDNVQGLIELEMSLTQQYATTDSGKEQIVISIRDNGGGIPDDVIERIFEHYYTTKGAEGTGIGLYMSKTIIETNMGGSLTVKNVDGGFEFVITLPAYEGLR